MFSERMAEKLCDEGFTKALENLEQLLAKRLAELGANQQQTVGAAN